MTVERDGALDRDTGTGRGAATRRRRGLSGFILATIVVFGLVAAFFIADAGVRNYAENQAKAEIAAHLPDSVTGDVSVSIGGLSVIAQYLMGSFDRVTLVAPALTVNGVPASVHLVATDVPIDQTKQVGDVRGTVDLDQAALNTLLAAALPTGAPAADLVLGDGTVQYAGSVSVFGLNIGYQATATPTAAADSLLFTPSSAQITTGAGSIDATAILPLVLGQQPVRVCVAGYLPEGVNLAGVEVTPGRARITLESSTLMLTAQSLTTLGTCSAG